MFIGNFKISSSNRKIELLAHHQQAIYFKWFCFYWRNCHPHFPLTFLSPICTHKRLCALIISGTVASNCQSETQLHCCPGLRDVQSVQQGPPARGLAGRLTLRRRHRMKGWERGGFRRGSYELRKKPEQRSR